MCRLDGVISRIGEHGVNCNSRRELRWARGLRLQHGSICATVTMAMAVTVVLFAWNAGLLGDECCVKKKRGLHEEMLEKAINHQFESSGLVQLKHPKIIRLGIGPQLGLYFGRR